MANCYYKILGVSIRASQEEIKRAFRMLALRWHPDCNRDDPLAAERFKEALEAYENLVDPSKRGRYDKVRRYVKPRTKARSYNRRPRAREASSSTVEEILREVFGVACSFYPKEQRRTDLRFDLQISQSAAIEGIHEQIVFRRWVFCQACMENGRKALSAACAKCNGRGEFEESCSLDVWVPAGSRQGTRLRIAGVGDRQSPSAPPGDLIICLHVVEGK